jgi:hypothetical protein
MYACAHTQRHGREIEIARERKLKRESRETKGDARKQESEREREGRGMTREA